jgi:hypothetical protein
MDSFQIIVLVVAVILLIIIFTSVGIITKYYSLDSNVFPSMANTCPDTWGVDGNNNCVIPASGSINTGVLYNGSNINIDASNTPGYDSNKNVINFSDNALWATGGRSALCNKKAWTAKNSIAWDGISNANVC